VVETQTDAEDDQHPDYLRPWVKAVKPGVFVEIKENVHILTSMQN
jgi:hypothetical protein